MAGRVVPETRPNRLYCGDCLQVLQQHVPNESVDLVYMDPPFGSGDTYEVIYKDGVEVRHFQDRWVGGKQGYLNWIEPRLRECHRVLKETGSFYLHCDDHLDGYLRTMLDDIFRDANFRNEIIWKRTSGHSDATGFGRVHDTILSYTKSDHFTWNRQFQPYSENYLRTHYRHKTPDGRVYRTDNLTATGLKGGGYEYEWKGVRRVWRCPKETMAKWDAEGRVKYTRNGVAEYVRYLDEMQGVPLQDVWTDLSPINSQDTDTRQGYPTQKPPELLERIIAASTNPGDLVLDPVCGCGTTVVAAAKLGRNWIGVDISPTACRLMAKRMGQSPNDIVDLPRSLADVREIMKLDPRGIEFQNWVCDILGAVSTTKRGDAPHADGGIDGWILSVTPISVKGSDSVGYPTVERFETSMRKRGKKEGFIVAFSFAGPAYEEAQRVRREEGVQLDLLEVKEKVVPVEGATPEVSTYLYSEITKQSWGDKPLSGPAPPGPLMITIRPVRKARVKRLGEALPSPPENEPEEED